MSDASGAQRDSIAIVRARRSPIGKFLGALSPLTGVEIGVQVVRDALQDLPEDRGEVRVVIGCARQAGTGPNPARQIALGAGLADTTVSSTINMACASGMEAIAQGARLLRAGEADTVVVGGTESMSRVPFLADRFRTGYRLGHSTLVDAMYKDGFNCPLAQQIMGETAETLAREYDIPRAEQDEFAAESQRKGTEARASKRFASELVPITVPGRKGDTVVEEDEHPRDGVTAEGLAKLKPVFASDGTITAGNASGITDGAAALVLMSKSRAERLGLEVMATMTDWTSAGVDPRTMGIGPVPAVRSLLQRTNLELSDIDLVELNEAFAAQVLACDRDLGLDRETLNVNGGAISLGHPIGCTGTRIVVTLLHEMIRRDVKRGVATLCVSGGMGMAMLLERGQ